MQVAYSDLGTYPTLESIGFPKVCGGYLKHLKKHCDLQVLESVVRSFRFLEIIESILNKTFFFVCCAVHITCIFLLIFLFMAKHTSDAHLCTNYFLPMHG